MSIIWIVEKAKDTGPSLAAALMGDYAVRVFASAESFEKLLRLARNQRPDVLVVDRASVAWQEARLREFLDFHFHETPVVFVGAEGVPAVDRFFHMPPQDDGLRLSVFVAFVLRAGEHRGRRAVTRYRDVLLDFEKLQCLVMPGDEPVSLPLKEAQILKLLIERPGRCLTRDEIKTAIWDSVKVTPRTIDSHVSRLRKRLQDAEVNIQSVYGGGYVLK